MKEDKSHRPPSAESSFEVSALRLILESNTVTFAPFTSRKKRGCFLLLLGYLYKYKYGTVAHNLLFKRICQRVSFAVLVVIHTIVLISDSLKVKV